jgi:hypothetical protein
MGAQVSAHRVTEQLGDRMDAERCPCFDVLKKTRHLGGAAPPLVSKARTSEYYHKKYCNDNDHPHLLSFVNDFCSRKGCWQAPIPTTDSMATRDSSGVDDSASLGDAQGLPRSGDDDDSSTARAYDEPLVVSFRCTGCGCDFNRGREA